MKKLVDEVIVHNLEVANVIVRALEEKPHSGVTYEVEWNDLHPMQNKISSNDVGLKIYEVTTVQPEKTCGFGIDVSQSEKAV